MDGIEARQIIEDLREDNQIINFENDCSEVILQGHFTLEDLQAILHVMEYDD